MKNKKLLLVLFIIPVLMLSACAGEDEPVEDESQDAIAVEVEAVVQKDLAIETFAMGELSPNSVYNVNALVSGDVVQVKDIKPGDTVTKDDILFVLDKENLQETRSNQLRQLNISKQQAENSLQNAKKTYEDNLILFETGSIAKMQLDNSKLQYDQAQLQYEQAISQINSTMDELDTQSDNLEVRAPVSGIVSSKNIEKDMFATNQNGFTIIQNDPIIFNAGIIEKYINEIKVGQKARVRIPTLDQEVEGEVKSVSISKQGSTYPVEITIGNQALDLRPGMYAEVNITYNQINDSICVPREAVLDENGTKYVYVLGEAVDGFNKVIRKNVEVLGNNDTLVRINNQELLGEQVVTKGNTFISSETLVNVK